jgi:hypothetical protein
VTNIEERLYAALSALGLPVAQGLMRQQAESWIVYTYGTVPAFFADDEAQYVKHLIDVHLYAPHGESLTALRAGVTRALIDAGCTYPAISVIARNMMDEDVRQHLAFRCEIEEAVGYGDVSGDWA